jgi:membrane associated rhomboid family serine protease
MIPLRTENRLSGKAWVTWGVAIACTAVLVRLALMPDERAAAIVWELAVVPSRLLAVPFAPTQLLTLVTATFLHAGWLHLAGNLIYLLVFGPTVEYRCGHGRFFLLYLASGAVGALLHALVYPASDVPLVGASAAIAGVLGAHLLLEPRVRVTTAVPVVVFFEIASLPAGFLIALWFALQVVLALAPATQSGVESVAWFAHVGGFATGAVFALPLALGSRRRMGRKRTRR